MDSYMYTKAELRKVMLDKRKDITEETRTAFGISAKKRFIAKPEFTGAGSIMLYMDFRNEAPTLPLIEAMKEMNKVLILPYTDNFFQIHPYIIDLKNMYDFLEKSSFGIWEPNLKKAKAAHIFEIDLVIVPGLAFDRHGNRLGYGKGCYDRFLPSLLKNTPKLAYGYDFQVLDNLPTDANDVKLNGFL